MTRTTHVLRRRATYVYQGEGNTIHKYFDSICRIIVAETSSLARTERDQEGFARYGLTELDIVYRLGTPFGHLARYRSVGSDLHIPALGLEAEVKYFRPADNATGSTVARTWDQAIQKDYDRLIEAMKTGKKGHFAFIVVWPTLIPWRSLAQLGTGRSGQNPPVHPGRLGYLPFLSYDPKGNVRSIEMSYAKTEGQADVHSQKHGRASLNWHLYGQAADFLNIVLYW